MGTKDLHRNKRGGLHDSNPYTRQMKKLVLILILVILVAMGCSRINNPISTTAIATISEATGIPITRSVSTPPAFQSISSRACSIAKLPAIGETPWDTRLFDWSPDGGSLVYIEPGRTDKGILNLAVAPRFEAPQRLTSNAIGDVAWSPDGSHIAFIALRSDGLETVMTITAEGTGLRDWFPGDTARTDTGKGSKGIAGWIDKSNLWVKTDCGTGCQRLWQLHLKDGYMEEIYFYDEANHIIGGSDYFFSPDQSHVVLVSGGDLQIGNENITGHAVSWLSGEFGGQVKTIFADWSPDSSTLLFLRLTIDGGGDPLSQPELWVWGVTANQGAPLLPDIIAASWSKSNELIADLSLGQPSFGIDGSYQGSSATLDGPNLLNLGLYDYKQDNMIAFAPLGEVNIGYHWPGQFQQLLLKPVWSPQDEYLAYRDASGNAWILSLSDLTQYKLDTTGNSISGIKWSPDGRMLAVSTLDRLWVFAVPCSY